MKLLCIGDSIVTGHPFEESASFTNIIAEKTGWQVINGGVLNGTLEDCQKALDEHLAQRPEVVLLLCGANDAVYGAKDSRGIYRDLLGMAQKIIASGGVPVLVSPPLCFPHMVPMTNREDLAIGAHCGVNIQEHIYNKASIILREVGDLMRADWEGNVRFFIDLQKSYGEYSKMYAGLEATQDGYVFIGNTLTDALKQGFPEYI